MENMDIDIVDSTKQDSSPEDTDNNQNDQDQDTDSDIVDSDNVSENNSRQSSPALSSCTAKLVESPTPSVPLVQPSVSHRHSTPLNIDFANLSAISNGTTNAFNGGISTDPASELFFNYQLARNAASFAPFAFPNSPIFLPPSLLKPMNYIHQQANNPLRPLNLSLGTVSNPSDMVSAAAAAAAAAISMANSRNNNSNGQSTASVAHQSSSKLDHSVMVSSSNCNNGNSSKLQQQTNSSKRLSPSLLCVVCGDLSSGKHYGILACNGCSGFFKRSVRRKLIYRCQAGTGNCIIDKQHRNQCQACRLNKCISMGMNKDAVQNERQPRNTATIRPEVLMSDCNSERLLREGVAATVAAVFGLNNSLRRDNSLKQFNNIHQNHHSHHHSHNSDNGATTKAAFKEATSQNGKKFDLKGNNNSNNRECNDSALFNPNLCYPNPLSSLDYSQLSDISNSLLLLNRDSFYEISARILFMGVKWIKNLPSFVSLSFRDQAILLEESWTEIFILSAIQWSLPLEKCSIFSAANIPNGADHSLDIRVLNDTFERFRNIGATAGEFACLKALALFKPEARGLKEVSKIEQMQDQTQLMLMQQVKNQNSSNPIRFGKLLLMLFSLKIIPSDKIATIYFKKAIGNTTIEKLLCEMFKC